jgi:hypothetical protein
MVDLQDVIAVACDECDGAGFVFFGSGEEYSVMPCDCENIFELGEND